MEQFWIYAEIGFKHIVDWKAVDHLLFIIALCLRYQFADWRKLLLLVTAFTIGHSLTLALSALNLIGYAQNWIEFLIPVTILITAFSNLFVTKFVFKSRFPVIYFMALFFGLVHGLGFSNGLKSMLGKQESILVPLLGFNVGLEIGQLAIILALLLISFIFVHLLKWSRREILLFVSGGIFVAALQMALERLPK